MTVDIGKLEALASAAKAGGADWSDLDINTERMYVAEGALVRLYEFTKPAVLLEMLASKALAEEARDLYLADKKRLLNEVNDLRASIHGLKTGYEAYERVSAELRAEIDRLNAEYDKAWRHDLNDKNNVKALAAEVARLSAECEALRNNQSFSDAFYEVSGLLGVTGARPEAPLVVFRQEVVPALQAVIRNSRRYEWLRDGAGYCDTRDIPGMAPARMDAFIDAAMSKEAAQ